MAVRPFPYAHSALPDWREALAECLAALGPATGGASLGFLYATDRHAAHLPDLLRACKEATGVAHWVGSLGLGIAATDREYLDEPGLAMMLTDLPEADFQVLPPLHNLADVLRLGETPGADAQPAWFGIVHGDPGNPLLGELIEHLAARTRAGFLVGGLTSAREHPAQIADLVVRGGLSGVLLSERVAVSTRLTQGVSPLGPRHVVTRAERNVVMALDGRPALEVLREDIGETLFDQLERLGGYLFAGLPTQDSDTGDYLARPIVGIDPQNGHVAIGDYVEPGQPLMFCRRDGASAAEDMRRMLDSLKAGLPGPIRGALYFSCLGRGSAMFGEGSAELKLISASLGPVPLVGFYASGEIYRDHLYGYTGVLTVFT